MGAINKSRRVQTKREERKEGRKQEDIYKIIITLEEGKTKM